MLPQPFRQTLLALLISSAASAGALTSPDSVYTYLGYGTSPEARVTSDERTVLQLHPSARIVYVDVVHGNNSWDGLAGVRQGVTTTGPKKDLYYALQVVRQGQGDWCLIADGTDISDSATSFTSQLRFPQGLSTQYPFLLSTYVRGAGPGDDVTWRNTALYRTGTWYASGATGVTLNSMSNPAPYVGFRYAVVENGSLQRTVAPFSPLTIAGYGDGLCLENMRLRGRQLTFSLFPWNKVELDLGARQTNVHVRRSSFHKGLDQGIFCDKNNIGLWLSRCVFLGNGYDGDLRTSAGQTHAPTIRDHNFYTYSTNTRVSRCIFAHGANFGITARRGLLVYNSLFADNGGHLIVAGSSTDTNEDYGDVSAVVEGNVFSGMAYVNGTNLANGVILALSRLDESTLFSVQDNIANNASRLISPYYTPTYVCAAGTTTTAYLNTFRYCQMSNTTGLLSSVGQFTRASDAALFTFYREVGGEVKVARANLALPDLAVGDQLTGGAWTATITAVRQDTAYAFNGALKNFNNNITRNCGAQPFSQQVTNENGTATITEFVRTNNVVDAPADATGSNVLYSTVAATYLDPTRDAETYAVSLGYADSKSWLEYAVTRPDLDHCTSAVNWIRAGFNRLPV